MLRVSDMYSAQIAEDEPQNKLSLFFNTECHLNHKNDLNTFERIF